MAERLGQQLGNYQLTRLLGEGGFAEVYLGEHVFLKTQATINVLHTRLTQEEQTNFLAEAQTLVSLEHPDIVKVLDFGIDGTPPTLSCAMPRLVPCASSIPEACHCRSRRSCPTSSRSPRRCSVK